MLSISLQKHMANDCKNKKKENKEEIIKLIRREIHSERNKIILKIFNIHS